MSWPPNDDLDAWLHASWDALVRGVHDRRAAARTPALATIGTDGLPQVRTVVLRGADRSSGHLRVHTDRRARKVAELQAHPACVVHVYDKAKKLQLRIAGLATLHAPGTPVGDAAWAATSDMARRCYRVDQSPGSPIPGPDTPTFQAEDGGLGSFLAIQIAVSSIEMLYLRARGHRRARFIRAPHDWTGAWLVP